MDVIIVTRQTIFTDGTIGDKNLWGVYVNRAAAMADIIAPDHIKEANDWFQVDLQETRSRWTLETHTLQTGR